MLFVFFQGTVCVLGEVGGRWGASGACRAGRAHAALPLCLPPAAAPQGRFHFLSLDYGATFKALPTPGDTEGFGHEIRVHPRQADWLLAKVRRNECLVDRRR